VAHANQTRVHTNTPLFPKFLTKAQITTRPAANFYPKFWSRMKLYHYTSVGNAEKINKSGHLRMSFNGEAGEGVYLTNMTWGNAVDSFERHLRVDQYDKDGYRTSSTAVKTHARFVFNLQDLIAAGYEPKPVPGADRQFIVRSTIILDRIPSAYWETP
jgi:hypothetical protein